MPFCASRCGYCDFNTYTASQLPGLSIGAYLRAVHAEIALARDVLGAEAPPLQTVFVGGGTPTLLDASQLGELLDDVRDTFGLVEGAEITTEANPETLDVAKLAGLVGAGFNRLSVGMQSADEGVLRRLDRVHTPGGALAAVKAARSVGFDNISLDLIYGAPGETLDQWRASLESALSVEPEHLSAYALIVEEGTRLAGRIERGEIAMTDDDDLADKYLLAEETLTRAGFQAYEISNWARGPQHRARHNLAYWRGDNWWGVGPGSHSHVGGVRWWNVKHPGSYVARLNANVAPEEGRELLSDEEQHAERVLLQLRLADGLPVSELRASEQARIPPFVAEGLLELRRCPALAEGRSEDRLVLTLRGRLLADRVTRDLLD